MVASRALYLLTLRRSIRQTNRLSGLIALKTKARSIARQSLAGSALPGTAWERDVLLLQRIGELLDVGGAQALGQIAEAVEVFFGQHCSQVNRNAVSFQVEHAFAAGRNPCHAAAGGGLG